MIIEKITPEIINIIAIRYKTDPNLLRNIICEDSNGELNQKLDKFSSIGFIIHYLLNIVNNEIDYKFHQRFTQKLTKNSGNSMNSTLSFCVESGITFAQETIWSRYPMIQHEISYEFDFDTQSGLIRIIKDDKIFVMEKDDFEFIYSDLKGYLTFLNSREER